MAEARIIQPVVNGGEIGPEFRARTDVVRYQTALARCRNAILRAGGGSENRAGLEFIGFAYDETAPVLLVEFEGETGDNAYMLEFTNGKMRVMQDGGFVLYPAGDALEGEIVVIDTPFGPDRLQTIEYDQSNDVITIVTGQDNVYELRRFDHHIWTFVAQDFAAPTNVPTSVSVAATTGYADPAATDPYLADHEYAITTILEDTRETILSASDMVPNRLGWPANYNTITWVAPAGVAVEKYGVYKKRNTLWGLIGYTTALTYKDDNIAPDWSVAPPVSRNPFVDAQKKPRTVCYFQQRRVFGGTKDNPMLIETTRSAQLNNMARSEPTRDDDAVTIPMSGPRRQTIVALIPLDDLLVFTRSGEWYLAGDDEILNQTSFPRPSTNFGSEPIRPIVVGSRVLMVERLGKIVRDIFYSFEAQNYQSPENRSIFVRHFFRNRKIIGWCFKPEDGVAWICCDDGTFFTFTYLQEHDVWGWSMCETDGQIERVRSVKEDTETAVYMQVRRQLGGVWRRTIERVRTRKFTTIKDAFFVDCGISYDNPLAATLIFVGAGNVDLTIAAHGVPGGAELDIDLKGMVDVDGAILSGTYFADVLDADTIRLVDADGDPVDADEWVKVSDEGVIREKVDVLTGWQHLAGMAVSVLADGAVVNGVVVNSTGDIVLPFKAGRVHGGRGYVAEWETLELKRGEQTTEGVIKSTNSVTMRVFETQGLWIGPSWDKLREPLRPEVEYGPAELSNDDIELTMDAEWNEEGRVHVRQSDPLPATILAFIPDVVYGGV